MFRPMRRHRQQLSQGDCAAILSRGTSGVLAVAGDGGYPYAVPLSYVYQEGTLFFHCAKAGHKLTPCVGAARRPSALSIRIRWSPGVHHLLSQRHRLRPDPYFGGRGGETSCHLAPGGEILPRRQPEHRQEAIRREAGGLCLVSLSIEHMTGKQAIELVQEDRPAG